MGARRHGQDGTLLPHMEMLLSVLCISNVVESLRRRSIFTACLHAMQRTVPHGRPISMRKFPFVRLTNAWT